MVYTDEQVKGIVKDLANTDVGLAFIKIMLEELNAYGKGIAFDNVNMAFYNQGKRDKGIWLLDKLRESNFNKFVEIQKERNSKCQNLITQD